MGRTRRSEKTDFDDSNRSTGRKRGHARNVPGVGMREVNTIALDDDVELDEDIAIYFNNTRLYKHIT